MELATLSHEALLERARELQATNLQLAQQNAKLVLLNKERDVRLLKCEAVIRRYRARLVRWFEDMKTDPLAFDTLEAGDPGAPVAAVTLSPTIGIREEDEAK
ncbi:hypothetical protein GMRT_15584 [Giardia muris]|uniref:Uncharacterized protein n=1 Tax=Giardia muris TaxID=5742 RepID=A0A4Z1SV73_GIAMU|nr:hypothetical protein GMRT_15584 [Giardia muris]|eukprot:TNJ28825.1 hypothetical protein GMRT_15584 [Giardia muris]